MRAERAIGVGIFIGFVGVASLGGCDLVAGIGEYCETGVDPGCGTAGSGGTVATTGPTTGGGTSGTGGGGGTTTTLQPGCVPKDEGTPIDDECGVFVSASKGDDATGKGTKEQPVATLAKALELADINAVPVYMCGETFPGVVEITGTALIFGGLDCATDWKYGGDVARTQSTADFNEITLRVATNANVDMYNVKVTAANATIEGGSSIAMLAAVKATVHLTRSDVEAGTGFKGIQGAPHATGAQGGAKGVNGGQACSAGNVVTPDALPNECGEVDSVGGPGGVGMPMIGAAAGAGEPFELNNGGSGDVPTLQCGPGTEGGDGAVGTPGAGANGGLGFLDGTKGFIGLTGDTGAPGKVGQGGGGGGGARGGTGAGKCPVAAMAGGASGGSGGSGGCGGLGGKGGGAGGASIAIVSLGAEFTFANVTITAKAGGAGASGGPGQGGGVSGGGGTGGTLPAAAVMLKPGCSGGFGGLGGDGGKGGGGRGGHSIGIAYTGTTPVTEGAFIKIGTAAIGGTGEGPNGNGAAGVAVAVQVF